MNLLAGRRLPPIICTLDEAQRILGPVAAGYPWAQGTIRDLWHRCAPMPGGIIGTPSEQRLISPAHLGEWLEDVLQRQGRPLTDSAQLYNAFMGEKHVRHGTGNRPGA